MDRQTRIGRLGGEGCGLRRQLWLGGDTNAMSRTGSADAVCQGRQGQDRTVRKRCGSYGIGRDWLGCFDETRRESSAEISLVLGRRESEWLFRWGMVG